MAAKLLLALALAASPSTAAVLGKGGAFLGTGMQPEVVARTLSTVEDEWKAQAAVFAECNSTSGLPGSSIVNCADAPSSFGKSCGTVVSAIVQGSGGDRAVAKEYMVDVCSQSVITGWHQQQCHNLATTVQGAMSADKYANRVTFDTGKLCTGFWSRFLADEQKRMAQEKAEREAAEKKAAEEEKAEREAAEKKAAEEAELKKKEQEQREKEEAEMKAAEAKAKAAEAAAKVAQKKAEAEAVAQAAKQKMAEAEEAERENKKAAVAAKATEKAPEAAAKATEKAPEAPKAEPVKLAAKVAAKAEVKAAPAEAKPVKVEAKPAVAVAAPAKAEKKETVPEVKPTKVETKAPVEAAKPVQAAKAPETPPAPKPAAAKDAKGF